VRIFTENFIDLLSNYPLANQEHPLMETNATPNHGLPFKGSMKIYYILSIVIAVLTAAAAVVSLLNPAAYYPQETLRQSLLPNDVVNLVIGLPILLLSMGLTARGKLVGLLFWPGALFYPVYNYTVYLFALPHTALFTVYLALVALSAYALIGLVAGIDKQSVGRRLEDRVPEKFAGGIAAAFGIIFIVRVIAVSAGAALDQSALPAAELGTLISDFLISPAMILGGIMLWQKKALGYTAGLGLLFQASMLFIGLILLMVLQPLMFEGLFSLADVLIVAVMGLICFVPFGMYLRGVTKK
jgi:hypothetical protein